MIDWNIPKESDLVFGNGTDREKAARILVGVLP